MIAVIIVREGAIVYGYRRGDLPVRPSCLYVRLVTVMLMSESMDERSQVRNELHWEKPYTTNTSTITFFRKVLSKKC